MSERAHPRLGPIALRLGLAAAGMLFAAAGVELCLRAFWCNTASANYEDQSGPFLTMNPYWGAWHFPNADVRHRRSCFDAHYRTNEFGMKSDPVRSGATKIALLGDSFVEGYGNDNESTAARFIEDLIGSKYQVLNFGVSGFFSTVDELALYDNFTKFFDPKVVVLFFLNYNDLADVLNADKARLVDRELKFVYPTAKTFDEIAAVVKRPEPRSEGSEQARSHWCMPRLLEHAGKVIGHRAEMVLNFRWDFSHELARPYLPEEEPRTRQAWSIVEAALGRFGELTRANGAAFVVVDIADPFQLDANWLRITSLREGTELSPTRPNRRLRAICEKLGIRFYDLYDETSAYIRDNGLRYPFLSFRCDRHYDRTGQQLMGTLVARYLRRERLVHE